jgi:hypothetical protein
MRGRDTGVRLSFNSLRPIRAPVRYNHQPPAWPQNIFRYVVTDLPLIYEARDTPDNSLRTRMLLPTVRAADQTVALLYSEEKPLRNEHIPRLLVIIIVALVELGVCSFQPRCLITTT